MPPSHHQEQFKVKKKCVKACEQCRSTKVKCSGTQPCAGCERRRKRCFYAVEEKRISVPESYLRELQDRRNRDAVPTSLRAERPPRPDHERAQEQEQEQEHLIHSSPQVILGSSPNPAQVDADADADADADVHVQDTESVAVVREGFALINDDRTHQRPETHQSEPHRDISAATSEGVGPGFDQNPLADNDYTFAKAGGRFWYMGPSSSWSFCRRVLALVGKRLPEESYTPDPWHLDGGAFGMQWKPLGYDEAPDVSNLPPLDYSLFLFNTVKFYFGPLFYLIDEPSYLRHLHELYQDAPAKAKSCRLWYSQFLFILAFGKAFIANARSKERAPAGHQYALRAAALLPDLTGLNVDRMLSIQVLALASVYFQSIDMRVAAFHHIGQALRICIIEGMHRHMPEKVVGIEYSRRCNTAFWGVYMLDREFSALIGAPSSIRDEDITAKLPSQINDSLDASNMTLHVRISRLVARITTTVYGVGKEFDGSLVPNTRSILRELAQVSEDLTALLNAHFQGSVSKASRMAQRLILSYHHCVVLTTRPLVMCTLHMHIQQADRQGSVTINLTPPVASLIQSCVDSAQTVLRTLRVLGNEDMLEAFLPFQLEDAFSSAFLLYIIRAISPSLLSDDNWRDDIYSILDTMISKGCIVAPLRKLELKQLEDTMSSLTPGLQHPLTPALTDPNQQLTEDGEVMFPESAVPEPAWDIFGPDYMCGLLPHELLDLAEQLDIDMDTVDIGPPNLQVGSF